MFRADPDHKFRGPHQNGDTVTAGLASESDAAVILVHGRGASAKSILSLADEINEPGVYYVAPQADRFTWYPYSFLVPEKQNQPGLNSALQAVFDRMVQLEEKGFTSEKIILAGFSQGACLVSEFAVRHPERYGGVVALSGGLIGESVSEGYTGSLQKTPVFLGCSDVDPHIPVERVDKTGEIFEKMGADVTKKIYPGMAHTVNRNELEHMKQIIQSVRNG